MREIGNCIIGDESDSYCWHSIEEALGLESIASFDDPDSSYSFDMFTIWKRKSDGALFYGKDSGCSCPEPFEGVKNCDGLNAITPNSWDSFRKEFKTFCAQRAEPHNEEYTEKVGPRWVELPKMVETLDRVRALLYARMAP